MADGFGNYQASIQDAGVSLPAVVGNASTSSGTTAERNATTPAAEGALWVLTDSNPPYQISVWNGSAWV